MRGEEIVITRHEKAMARLVPEGGANLVHTRQTVAELRAGRSLMAKRRGFKSDEIAVGVGPRRPQMVLTAGPFLLKVTALIRPMVSRRAIKRFSDEIVRRFQPEKVILFGSYAYGQPTEDSDVDLLVVMPYDRRQGRMSLRILEAMDYDFPLDLLVRTPAEVRQRLRWGDCFLQEVVAKGKILYEAAHA